MPRKCDCVPAALGYYWATHRAWGRRVIVQIAKDGFGHVRAYVHRYGSSSYSPCDFKDYSKAIVERKPAHA